MICPVFGCINEGTISLQQYNSKFGWEIRKTIDGELLFCEQCFPKMYDLYISYKVVESISWFDTILRADEAVIMADAKRADELEEMRDIYTMSMNFRERFQGQLSADVKGDGHIYRIGMIKRKIAALNAAIDFHRNENWEIYTNSKKLRRLRRNRLFCVRNKLVSIYQ